MSSPQPAPPGHHGRVALTTFVILLTAAAAGGAWLLSRRDRRWLSWDGWPTLRLDSREADGPRSSPDSSKPSEHGAASGISSTSAARSAGPSAAASVDADRVQPAQHVEGRVLPYPDYLAQLTAASDPDRKSRLLELHRAALVC